MLSYSVKIVYPLVFSSKPVVSTARFVAFNISSLCTFAFNDLIAAGADFDEDAEFWRCNLTGKDATGKEAEL